ncbi:hypothetical protein POM88_038031 [Heracleum sosnowskyi]|uniref:Uncharacterized protein n=1 Tax=Heracleum sosnowskyi TaxID=360622 RepID=A0AAD8HSK1_9APIA|nr:hypothetical protein POM88_038031 [Heracleum sosnowskyi]
MTGAVPELCVCVNTKFLSNKSEICGGLVRSSGSSSCVRVLNVYGKRRCRRWRVKAAARSDVNVCVIEKSNGSSGSGGGGGGNVNGNRSGLVDIPSLATRCNQLLGVPDQAEKDEIVKAVMHLKSSEIDEGYTTDAVVSRQNLLVDVRDKLLFEPEYAGNTRANVLLKAYLRIPWAWLPGALCLLQEVNFIQQSVQLKKLALRRTRFLKDLKLLHVLNVFLEAMYHLGRCPCCRGLNFLSLASTFNMLSLLTLYVESTNGLGEYALYVEYSKKSMMKLGV